MDSQISENTKITLGVVAVMLGFVSTSAMMFFQVQASAKEIEIIKAKQEAINALQIDIAVIKSEVHDIKKKLNE